MLSMGFGIGMPEVPGLHTGSSIHASLLDYNFCLPFFNLCQAEEIQRHQSMPTTTTGPSTSMTRASNCQNLNHAPAPFRLRLRP